VISIVICEKNQPCEEVSEVEDKDEIVDNVVLYDSIVIFVPRLEKSTTLRNFKILFDYFDEIEEI